LTPADDKWSSRSLAAGAPVLTYPFPWLCDVSREVFDQVGGYDENVAGGEDQDLFARMAARGLVLTLRTCFYSYRYHSSNATLLNGTRAVGENHSQNGDALAAFYMLGAMRLGRAIRNVAGAHARERVFEVESQDIDDSGFSSLGHISPSL